MDEQTYMRRPLQNSWMINPKEKQLNSFIPDGIKIAALQIF
jgi:hypothetical protein